MPTNTRNILQASDAGYEEFLGSLDLVWVGLKGCSVSLNRRAMAEMFSGKKKLVRRFADTYKVLGGGSNFFEASGSFVVTVQESDEAKPALVVECEFDAHLHCAEPLSKVFVERFVSAEFQLIVVPYARQFISSTTAQMGLPPLVIPLSIASSSKRYGKDKTAAKKSSKTHAKAR
jgi:hypothetical protein